MTTIAYKDGVLASDRRATSGSEPPMTVDKLYQLNNGAVLGFAGMLDEGFRVVDWINAGMYPDEKPKVQHSEFIYLTVDGPFYMEKFLRLLPIVDPFFAIGSGAQYALGAMASGRSAAEAVEVASRFDPLTGNGVLSFQAEDRIAL